MTIKLRAYINFYTLISPHDANFNVWFQKISAQIVPTLGIPRGTGMFSAKCFKGLSALAKKLFI